ncbi:hypothetical protein EZS27_021169 [termite gut metagenome]|uniref:Uncharacterized protein n=1 Tax=termite gut metagenome TaxID=433724 RepID=A0A5J4RAE5_9ZZZZ
MSKYKANQISDWILGKFITEFWFYQLNKSNLKGVILLILS